MQQEQKQEWKINWGGKRLISFYKDKTKFVIKVRTKKNILPINKL
jgi:hypothetical protein